MHRIKFIIIILHQLLKQCIRMCVCVCVCVCVHAHVRYTSDTEHCQNQYSYNDILHPQALDLSSQAIRT